MIFSPIARPILFWELGIEIVIDVAQEAWFFLNYQFLYYQTYPAPKNVWKMADYRL